MKITLKSNKVAIIIIFTVIILIGIFLLTDIIRLENEKEPIFSICASHYLDGGTKVYIGLGYKIIDYKLLLGFNGYKVGPWFMRYDSNLE